MKNVISIVVSLSLFAIGSLAFGADFKDDHGPPEGYNHKKYAPCIAEEDYTIEFAAFYSVFDGVDDDNGDGESDVLGIPEFVSYELRAEPVNYEPSPFTPSRWITDEDLNEQGIMPDHWSYHYPNGEGNDHDRGHLCTRSHAARISKEADWNTHTFYNGVPQYDQMNQGIWWNLESKISNWTNDGYDIWIVTGPVFFWDVTLEWHGEPDKGEVLAAIPHALFKVLVRENMDSKPEVLAFIYPNEYIGKVDDEWVHEPFFTSVDYIEELTGLNFFPFLSVEQQQLIESTQSNFLW